MMEAKEFTTTLASNENPWLSNGNPPIDLRQY